MRYAVVLGGLLVAGLAAAQGEPPVLHEYVAPPAGASASAGSEAKPNRTIGAEPEAGQNPAAVRTNDKLVPEPSAEQPKQPEEPVHGTPDFGADRDTSMRPDYATGSDDSLKYVEVFDPSVVPFKRMSALDLVQAGYTLGVHDKALTAVAVGGRSQAERDLFWGNLLVELSPGEDVAIPSTAPDMRILSYEIDPPVSLTFSKDGADNYFVRSDEKKASGTFRLVFLSDAPASYFSPGVPRGHTLADASRSGLVPPVPAAARKAAAEVIKKLGISARADAPLDQVVDKLVAYYRAFEAGEPPPATRDIYLDLALSQTGVCRHRAFAFMVTAQALGIPARFVANEAHAFVEIWVPGQHWLRIDLGGAALNLDVGNASDKSMYRPRGEDPFPKPPEYTDNYTQLRGDVRGLSKDQIAEARGEDGPAADRPSGSTDPIAPTPGVGLPSPPPAMYEGKAVTKVAVGASGESGFRGEVMQVSGRLSSDSGARLAGLPVNLYLAPAGAGGDGARLVGETFTDEEGSFRAAVDVPRDLPLGRYEIFASTPGDARHQPALSP